MSQTKRKYTAYCPLSHSDVNIEVFDPGASEERERIDEQGEPFMSFGELMDQAMADEEYDIPDIPKLRISDLINHLYDVKRSEGDLILCVADTTSLLTLSSDDLDLEIIKKRNYEFAFGLDEEKYLSVKI